MKADRSRGEARPAARRPVLPPDVDATLSEVPPRQPRRLRKRSVRLRWDRFDNDEVFCLLSVMQDDDQRHQYSRGIEPERSLLAELERECRRRGLVHDE